MLLTQVPFEVSTETIHSFAMVSQKIKLKQSSQLDQTIQKLDSKSYSDCWGLSMFKSMGTENTAFAFVFIVAFVSIPVLIFLFEFALGKYSRY